MAGEIRYGMSLTLNNGGVTDAYNTSGLIANQTFPVLVRNVQKIPDEVTAPQGEMIMPAGIGATDDFPGITPGLAIFKNLDSANYVEIGLYISGTFYAFLKLGPGEQSGPMFLGITTGDWNLYARSNTAEVDLFYIIYAR